MGVVREAVSGVVRGTVLAGLGIAGWLFEEAFGYLGGALVGRLGVAPPSAVIWMLACSAGVVIGDLLTAVLGGDVSTGRAAGVAKGLVASLGGIVGLTVGDGYAGLVLGIWLPTVTLDLAGY